MEDPTPAAETVLQPPASEDAGDGAPGSASAIVVPVQTPDAIERIRRRHDPSAAAEAPAHVTVLFPFLDATRLDDAVHARLADIVAGQAPFRVSFPRGPFSQRGLARARAGAAVHRPDARKLGRLSRLPALRRCALERDSPPHHRAERRPGCDVRNRDPGAFRAADRRGPEGVEVLGTGSDGRWYRHWRMPFGAGAGARDR